MNILDVYQNANIPFKIYTWLYVVFILFVVSMRSAINQPKHLPLRNAPTHKNQYDHFAPQQEGHRQAQTTITSLILFTLIYGAMIYYSSRVSYGYYISWGLISMVLASLFIYILVILTLMRM